MAYTLTKFFSMIILIIFLYLIVIYHFQLVPNKIDALTGQNYNEIILEKIDEILWNITEIEQNLDNDIWNIAPNTTRNIKWRTWQ